MSETPSFQDSLQRLNKTLDNRQQERTGTEAGLQQLMIRIEDIKNRFNPQMGSSDYMKGNFKNLESIREQLAQAKAAGAEVSPSQELANANIELDRIEAELEMKQTMSDLSGELEQLASQYTGGDPGWGGRAQEIRQGLDRLVHQQDKQGLLPSQTEEAKGLIERAKTAIAQVNNLYSAEARS